MDYYQDSAFTLAQLPGKATEDAKALPGGDAKIDLRDFTDCTEFMGSWSPYNSFSTWLRERGGKFKWEGKSTRHRFNNRHKYYFIAMPFSNGSFIFLLGMFTQIGFWGFLFVFTFLNSTGLFDSPSSLPKYFFEPGQFYLLIGLYLTYRIARYFKKFADDSFGFTFDRPSGKVMMIGPKKTVTYYFKDFDPVCSVSRTTGGAREWHAYLTHRDNGLCIGIASGAFVDCVLTWNYLLQFMDISKPLPDIPEHEHNRHLDPTTKAHDQKIKREADYWHQKGYKEMNALHGQARQRAKKVIYQLAAGKGKEQLALMAMRV
jgi:hypothetical protein